MVVRIPLCVDGHFREGGRTNKEFLGTSVVWIVHVFSVAENSRHRGMAFFCTQMIYKCQVPTMGAGNAKCRDIFPPWNTFHVLHISYQQNETDVEGDSQPNSPFLPFEKSEKYNCGFFKSPLFPSSYASLDFTLFSPHLSFSFSPLKF